MHHQMIKLLIANDFCKSFKINVHKFGVMIVDAFAKMP